MENHFVTYNIALKLKELGFDEDCMKYFNKNIFIKYPHSDSWINSNLKNDYISAPLWQQAIDWLREKKEIQINVTWNKFYPNTPYEYEVRPTWKEQLLMPYGFSGMTETYYKSRETAVLKALELLTKNK